MQNSSVGAFLQLTSKISVKSPKAVGLSKCVNWAGGIFKQIIGWWSFRHTLPLLEADMTEVLNILSLWVKSEQVFFFIKPIVKDGFYNQCVKKGTDVISILMLTIIIHTFYTMTIIYEIHTLVQISLYTIFLSILISLFKDCSIKKLKSCDHSP